MRSQGLHRPHKFSPRRCVPRRGTSVKIYKQRKHREWVSIRKTLADPLLHGRQGGMALTCMAQISIVCGRIGMGVEQRKRAEI